MLFLNFPMIQLLSQLTKTPWKKPSLPSDFFATLHFKSIVSSIYRTEFLQIVLQCRQKLETSGDPCSFALDKINSCLTKNPGWQKINTVNDCIMGKSSEIPGGMELKDIGAFKFSPTTSVDVERSFSEHKALMRTNRCRFNEENLLKHLVISYNCKRLH